MALLVRVAQDPSFVTRQAVALGAIAAGAAGQSSKFVAHAALLLFSLNVNTTAVGTSTYTFTGPNGTATVNVASQQLSVIRVYNTAAAGSSVSLATQTIGPFPVSGGYAPNGTYTNQVGAYTQWALNTASGTTGYGGVPVNAGDYLYVVSGTDTTAAEVVTLDYQIANQAPLTV